MIEILICDDSQNDLDFIVQTVENYLLMEELDMNVALATTDPNAILNYARTSKAQLLCFLDIEILPSENIAGVTLASEIKKFKPDAGIIFVTAYAKYMALTFEYKTEAIGYILKDGSTELKAKIIHYLDYANEKYNKPKDASGKRFAIKVGDKVVTEPFEDIVSFEITSKNISKITLYAKTRSHEFAGTLDEIIGWDERFFRCGRSTIVNTVNIDSLDKREKKVHMINGDVCLASARGMKELEQILRNRS